MYIYFVYVSDELGHNFGTVCSFIKDIEKEIKGSRKPRNGPLLDGQSKFPI